jgi:hypothetical protein
MSRGQTDGRGLVDASGRPRIDASTAGSIGERLASARHDALIGRAPELAVLAGALTDGERVLTYVFGPGGVGKSALLGAFVAEAGHRERPVVLVDCADHGLTIPEFVRRVTDGAGADELADLASGTVVVIDRLEQLGELRVWFWPTFVAALPEGVTVVAAGRHAPPPTWTEDPAFFRHAVVLPVRNLPAAEAAALARSRGVVDEESVTALVRESHGHPLAIVVGSEVARPGDGPSGAGVLLDHPDAVVRLLGHFLDDPLDESHRAALHVCGHARRVDRELLGRVLGLEDGPADEMLTWLQTLPYAERHPDGLTLHEVVRDALDRDLRWRDRSAFSALHGRIRSLILERMEGAVGAEHDRCARDLLHLHRGNPEAQRVLGLGTSETVMARPLRVADADERDRALALFRAAGQGAIATRWMAAPLGDATALEDGSGRLVGATLMARLDHDSIAVGRCDRVTGGALHDLARSRPVEPDETVLHHLVATDGDPSRFGAITDRMATVSFRHWSARGVGWVILSTTDEKSWGPTWSYIGFERLGGYRDDGEEGGIWARDFLRSPFADWQAQLALHELDESGTAPPPLGAPVALSRHDFSVAVRALLKDLPRRDRVRRSPLAASSLARAGPDPVDSLVGRVHQAMHELAADPRVAPAARAVDRTYVRPAGTQERAAEVLGLPFSTYRRHLATGIERLDALLWDWELHGASEADPAQKRAGNGLGSEHLLR